MIRLTNIIRDFRHIIRTEGLNPPIGIEFGQQECEQLREELIPMIRYGDFKGFESNECMLFGIKLIAPKDFKWADIPKGSIEMALEEHQKKEAR